jgi:hypothetical protein
MPWRCHRGAWSGGGRAAAVSLRNPLSLEADLPWRRRGEFSRALAATALIGTVTIG